MITNVTVEKLKDGKWYYLSKNMEDLKPGDVFRMWFMLDDGWEAHLDLKGCSTWVTTSTPFIDENNLWRVYCERTK